MTSVIQRALAQERPFPSIEAEVFVALQVAANRTLDPWARYLRSHAGLTANQYNVLRILRGAGPTGLTCSQISDRMISRDPDVTRLTDRLVRDGLAQRVRPEGDRRVVEVRITPVGLDTLAHLDRDMSNELLGGLGDERLRALRDLLADVIVAADNHARRDPDTPAPARRRRSTSTQGAAR